MVRSSFTQRLFGTLLLTATAGAAHAVTLHVNCGQHAGLTTIGAAVQAIQSTWESRAATILVTGQCRENVVIQGIDRLTLTAVNGASLTDASGGKLDVISIQDSRDVAINGFTINAGANGVDISSGINCLDFSVCRLSGNVIQGAADQAGLLVSGQSMATLDGDTLQNNTLGLEVISRSSVRMGGQGRPFISRGNFYGIYLSRDAFVFVGAVVENNTGPGATLLDHSTLEISGSISGNGGAGAIVTNSSYAAFGAATVSGNAGPGVRLEELSMGRFNSSTVITRNAGGGVLLEDISMGDFNFGVTVTGNTGTDVVCNPQFAATRGTGRIGGGTTNCVEP